MAKLATPQAAAEADARRTSAHCPAYPLGDSWVVFDRANDRLLTLNQTAYRIWQAWQHGLDAHAISQRLSEWFDISREQLFADVTKTLAEWQTAIQRDPQRTPADWRHPTKALLATEPVGTQDTGVCSFRIQQAGIRLHFDAETSARVIAPLFAHHTCNGDEACIDYHVETVTGGYRLRQGRRLIHQDISLDRVAVSLLNEINLAGYRELDPLCVLHAAGVGRDGHCILLPGIAGAGKSTLTAALLQTGLEYLSDDTVPIDRHDRTALALRPPLCLKDGSLPVLSSRYPALSRTRAYQRADQAVRYLQPTAGSADGRYQVKALVFPHYQPGSKTRLTPIPADIAFSDLLQAGVFASHPDDPASLGDLIDWVGGTDHYRLRYSDLDDAGMTLHRLLADRGALARRKEETQ